MSSVHVPLHSSQVYLNSKQSLLCSTITPHEEKFIRNSCLKKLSSASIRARRQKTLTVTHVIVQLTFSQTVAINKNNKQITKSAQRETQTLRAGCSKAEPEIFVPPQTPFPGAQDGQNLISWRWSLPLPTNPVWRGSMHAISSYLGNRPTHTHKQTHPPRHTQTYRTDYNTLRRS